ncbi:T-lymphocyte activation antigen CD86 isoform X2 [Macrotis lagotis]|uniref:T-lymphocyte activation antigen CD86 isoform X2 n=1 Tax=Macrotis lagotis TaxID=92651 RepID=UPI003D68FFAF
MVTMIWKIFTLLTIFKVPGVTAKEFEVQAFFNKTAKLPCDFKNYQNFSLDEVVIFWQGDRDNVLYEQYLGEEKQTHVHSSYINRTKFDHSTWTLQLQNVQIVDQGKYTCVVLYHGQSIIPHTFSFQLFVFAPFSQPEIIQLDNKTEEIGDIFNLSCSSNQGYPKPQEMYWKVDTKNSTKYHGDMQLFQDDINQLYNVTSTFSLLINDYTTGINITCFIQTQGPEGLLTSITLHKKIQSSEESNSNFLIPVVLVVGIVIVLLMIILALYKFCCHFCYKREATR